MRDTSSYVKKIDKSVGAVGRHGHGESKWRAASWERCLRDYRLDPSRPKLVHLGAAETKVEVQRFDDDLSLAAAHLKRILQIIEGGGYSAHIANNMGVIIAIHQSSTDTYNCTDDLVGSLWVEEIAGTNGIGTSLVERLPAAVYLKDHFFATMATQACAAAPFFRPDGEVQGVINLSTSNPNLSAQAHRLVLGIAASSAEELELSYFRRHFSNAFTLHFDHSDALSPVLLAVNEDFQILGSSSAARAVFAGNAEAANDCSLWDIFDKSRTNPNLAEWFLDAQQLRQLGNSDAMSVSALQPLAQWAVRTKVITVPSTRDTRTRQPAKVRDPARITLAEYAGNDAALRDQMQTLQRVFGSGLSILLTGETGVGKDVVANGLHSQSERAGKPFIAFNCAALPENLVDSELFGYVPGTFTGANKAGNTGRIVEAHGGTLLLDEIGDMPLTLQTRLLRFLETREVTPLGSSKPQLVDVQIIAATHQDLLARVAAGHFRQDLYYRLAGLVVCLPALREREDLVDIAAAIVSKVTKGRPSVLSERVHERLLDHNWPGNIRELRNVMLRAVHLAGKQPIEASDIVLDSLGRAPSVRDGTRSETDDRAAIVEALGRSDGNIRAGAAFLGISSAALHRKLRELGLHLDNAKP